MKSEKKDLREATKKPYISPQLISYGAIGKITEHHKSSHSGGGGGGGGKGGKKIFG